MLVEITHGVSVHERDIRHFFDYFRARYETIKRLDGTQTDPGPLSPDQSVILATAMDALAMYWANVYRPALNAGGSPARVRMQEFLTTFGRREIFERVSGPDLERRAHAAGKPGLFAALRKLYRDDGWDAKIRSWTDDRTLTEVLADTAVRETATPTEFMARSQYGQLLYREFRCKWVHELSIGDVSTRPFSDHSRYAEPHYENWIERGDGPSRTRRRPVFPREFLLASLTQVIDGFEAQCLADDRRPVD